jgi:glycosyltransferase involved in cell wall biosynthesis
MRPVAETNALRAGRRRLVCYLGIMGPQDGVDVLLHAINSYVNVLGRDDCHFALLGFGDCFEELKHQSRALGLDDYVTFTGRADAAMVAQYLSAADVGVSPDPLSPLNDVSTMNKTMEYMAFELPVVAFDLKETRVSAGDAARYVEPNNVEKYARAIVELLDDEERRRWMGRLGRDRVERVLAWKYQQKAYLGIYDRLTGRDADVGDDVGDIARTAGT